MDSIIKDLILQIVPSDGSSIGNTRLIEEVIAVAKEAGHRFKETSVEKVRQALIEESILGRGKGRGGSVYRLHPASVEAFDLAAPVAPEPEKKVKPGKKPAQAAAPRANPNEEVQVLSYRHADKRRNNPEVGMVTPATDPEDGKTRWCYDPHIDPALQFDFGRAPVEKLIDDALASGDEATMRTALEELKKFSSPYLNWAGKAERTTFDLDTVSLHVHERVDPASILSAVRKQMKEGKSKGAEKAIQPGLFDAAFENLPLRDAIDFYHHEKGWSNRLIAGDSLLVMNSLIQKEGMAGQVQMIYIDPPYGIKYGSNFQPFVNKRDVKDRKDEDLTQEPEMIKAFRDTWELGIHSYLTYLRDRLLLAKELLHESGSVFVQISDENVHHVREMMDELFGCDNFISQITVQKTTSSTNPHLSGVADYLVWYAKSKTVTKYRDLYRLKEAGGAGAEHYKLAQLRNGRRLPSSQLSSLNHDHVVSARLFSASDLQSAAVGRDKGEGAACWFPVEHEGTRYLPNEKNRWKTNEDGIRRAIRASRVIGQSTALRYVRFLDDFPAYALHNIWDDTGGAPDRRYVVETNVRIIERCIIMTTDPGDLVLDPTCGSGTTAFVAEKWGRRWITCDTSRVAVTLAKQRLMTASYDYFALRYPHEGLKGGFIYKSVPHVTLKSIANNPEIDEIYERMHPAIEAALAELNKALVGWVSDARASRNPPNAASATANGGLRGKAANPPYEIPMQEWEVPFDFNDAWPAAARQPFDAFHAARQAMQKKMDDSIASHADQETLYDQPQVEKNKLRITGPFSVEAVPFPSVLALEEAEQPKDADVTIARSGESARQHSWRDELLKTGIRGKGGQMLKFAELETLPGTRHLHATGHLDSGERVVVSFGPEHAALEQRQVAQALAEAGELFPLPKMIVFCAFAFDPEAAKDIDHLKGITALKAQMNTDLLTEDLKKGRASNQSFWLMGQPDVEVRMRKDGKFEVEVHGFDYFDTSKGELVSGGKGKIALWSLDTDYDERSLFPSQVFFPLAGSADGWMKLKKNIRAELNEELLSKFHGTVSLPFEAGENRKIAVKIVDDRGIESLKVIPLDSRSSMR